MQIILFEDESHKQFLPLTFTRPVGDLRIGILKISEKWEKMMQAGVAHDTRDYLQALFPGSTAADAVRINARIMPDEKLVKAIRSMDNDASLLRNDVLIARKGNGQKTVTYDHDVLMLERITDLFSKNGEALQRDFELLTKGRTSAPLHESNIVIGDKTNVFIEEGAQVYASTFNTLSGPIYIDKDAEVMEGSHVRGPFYLGEHSQLKLGTKIYGPTTVGPHSKIGGEVSNSVIQGFSNKGHDGFLGNSILGEWCNLGADTNTSNLKNNYSTVRIWNYNERQYADTGLTFCGLIMGDHSKCSINTMFNTGTVVGVCANIFGGDFPPKHVCSFSWGGSSGSVEYDLGKALLTAERVMARRALALDEPARKMLAEVFRLTQPDRAYTTQSQD
jgi:UDP-N-acetylglucosamine diphosphorylase/glucosamine-1-phosphate N-acetyltransferase